MDGLTRLGSYEGRSIYLDKPISSLPRKILWPLCINLSGEQPVYIEGIGGNWRTLASYIHLPSIMEEQIEDYARGNKRTTPAFTFFDLWDNGIQKNPGSIRKLVIAMHQSGLVAYLKKHVLAPLQGVDMEGVNDMLKSLSSDIRERLFPVLDLNDIMWDEVLDRKCMGSPDDEEEARERDEADQRPSSHSGITPDSVYVSHYADSSSSKYRTQVKNIVKALQQRGHTVWYNSSRNKEPNPYAWKERCITSAATIIVVYNKDYQKAHEAFLNGQKLPTCVAVDIPAIHHLAYSNSRVIIPVIIDICKTQPTIPIWLAKMPKVLYPSQETTLIRYVQRVPAVVVPDPPPSFALSHRC